MEAENNQELVGGEVESGPSGCQHGFLAMQVGYLEIFIQNRTDINRHVQDRQPLAALLIGLNRKRHATGQIPPTPSWLDAHQPQAIAVPLFHRCYVSTISRLGNCIVIHEMSCEYGTRRDRRQWRRQETAQIQNTIVGALCGCFSPIHY